MALKNLSDIDSKRCRELFRQCGKAN